MKNQILSGRDCMPHSPFWQALEYRKRLKRLIEQGFSIDELDKQAKRLFKALNDE
ncbi:hypothetical protein PHA51_00815 [Rodentibacter pneumotropicus]|uniref:hypothetical protein n=1 Tax=Rodentibacter pneumotropicus TaxID=758 RepID=UPI00232D3956|nr:hypothetical protein [Rodentibacter pneumotropicus]MDC2824580.1 hypothetical protein [Rodentibacter pneumotropicus]